METTKLTEALQQTAFGTVFPPDVVQNLANNVKWRHCPAGKLLFREGQQNDAFYIICRGHVMLEMCLPAQGCTQILTLGPGEIVAWSALVGEGRMTTNAMTVDDVDLIEFSGSELLRYCEADSQFGYRLMRQLAAALAKRLLATRLQMLDLFVADGQSSSQELSRP